MCMVGNLVKTQMYKKSKKEFEMLTPMCRQSHLREKMQNKTIRFKDVESCLCKHIHEFINIQMEGSVPN